MKKELKETLLYYQILRQKNKDYSIEDIDYIIGNHMVEQGDKTIYFNTTDEFIRLSKELFWDYYSLQGTMWNKEFKVVFKDGNWLQVEPHSYPVGLSNGYVTHTANGLVLRKPQTTPKRKGDKNE